MLCPKCDGKATVIDGSTNTTDNERYRKMKCKECGHIFYTSEIPAEFNPKFEALYKKNARWNNRH